jgi:hypothetical protein
LQPSHFEACVAVNLTTLLVLTQLFISVSDSQPRTAYVKMMDIWLIFSLLIPFAEVILQTIMDMYRADIKLVEDKLCRRQRSSNAKAIDDSSGNQELFEKKCRILSNLDKFAKFGLPLFFVLFALVFFLFGSAQGE